AVRHVGQTMVARSDVTSRLEPDAVVSDDESRADRLASKAQHEMPCPCMARGIAERFSDRLQERGPLLLREVVGGARIQVDLDLHGRVVAELLAQSDDSG